MGRPCEVCASPKRDAVDAALARGDSCVRIGTATGLSDRSINRHRRNHLSPAIVAIAAKRDEARVGSLVERLEAVTLSAERMLFAAERDGSSGVMMGWVREFRSCVELMAKLTGQLAPERPTQVLNIIGSPDVAELLSTAMSALRPFPDARVALASEWKRLGAEEAV